MAMLFLGLIATGCKRERIADINADPGSFHNRDINVGGTVIQSFGALNTGVYQIDDGTGRLWVFSDSHGVPSKGAVVGVKGRIVPTVMFMGVNYATVMRESDRRLGS
jgi:hypothetical protein